MKRLKTFTLGAILLAVASAAQAQTVIRIVASNGDRVATQTAISNILQTGWTYRGTGGNATSANLSVATSANFGAWKGQFNTGSVSNPVLNSVVIKTSYAGALAGIAAVASSPKIPQRFVVTDGSGTGAVPDPSTGTTLGTDYELGTADFGFSTNFQSTSPFNGPFQGTTYTSLIEEVVGVSPLGFYASPGFPTSAANITTQLAQLLYTTGSLPLALFTGDFTNDGNKIVYAIGRNTDAGQRFGAYTEVGLGTTTQVAVWKPTYSTAQTTSGGITYGGIVGGHAFWPAETVSNVYSPVGNGGYGTGAALAPQLTTVLSQAAYRGTYFDAEANTNVDLYPNASAGYYIGYLTPGDALTRVLGQSGTLNTIPASQGVALAYNGVPLHNAVNGTGATVNAANVQNGKYTAWLYNRMLKPSSGLSGLPLTFANALRDRIRNFDAPSGGGLFDDTTFKVKRSTDGGLVTKK